MNSETPHSSDNGRQRLPYAKAPEKVPMLVALIVTAVYWFTASTFFANPGVAVARSFSDTFGGIVPGHVPGFVLAQYAACYVCVQSFGLPFQPGCRKEVAASPGIAGSVQIGCATPSWKPKSKCDNGAGFEVRFNDPTLLQNPARACAIKEHLLISRRKFVAGAAGIASAAALSPAIGQSRKMMRVAVGPFLPTADDTKKAFGPVFAYLARELGVDYELSTTTDWAGMAVAMASGNLDLAWMGPWGYIIANNATDCQAIATVKYDDRPIYYAIVVGKPDLKILKFPQDSKGMTISFADVGSTSGWLIPSWYAREVWKIDPKAFWKYSEGATHPANEMAVQAGQIDLATDFDRNRNAMIAAGRIKADSTKIFWTSDPLPNDAIVVPKGTPKTFSDRVQKILTAITPEQAKTLLPPRYTGFVAATHKSYDMIEKAGLAVGKIKPK